MSGESTLVAALVQAGAAYLSDEYAALDRDGMTHPYAKTISLRNGKPVGEPVTAGELEGRVANEAVTLGAVVDTRYEAGAQSRPRTLPQPRRRCVCSTTPSWFVSSQP